VLLRGLMRETRHWGEFPTFLRDMCGGDAIGLVTLDLPGNGGRHQLRSPLRIAQMTDDCRAQLQQRGIAPPYRLLGLSLGAMVAVDWCTRFPGELQACVLINTSLRPFSPFYHRLRPRNYWTLCALALRRDTALQERRILRLTSRDGDADSSRHRRILMEWIGYRQQYPVTRRNALRQLLAAACFSAPRRKPDVPLLILASFGDRLVDPRCSQRLAACWHTTLIMHPDAGHDLPLDAGRWVAAQIDGWLAAQGWDQTAAPSVSVRTP
jgi:pimeloyl-ACP methyl ester carboxylesterase